MMRPYLPLLQILAEVDHSSEDRGLHNDTNRSDFFPNRNNSGLIGAANGLLTVVKTRHTLVGY